MNGGAIPISDAKLLLSIILVCLAGLVSTALKLGLTKSLAIGTVRTFLQLGLIGYVLGYVFRVDNPLLMIAVLTVMTGIAARTAAHRREIPIPGVGRHAFLALLISSFFVGLIVIGVIISPTPWYTSRIAIPIFGMILGNSMNGVALALDRLNTEVRSHAGEIETLLSFGATPWEAIRDHLKQSVRAGMIPTINSMMTVGIVSLPGMMTGQILSGADPIQAVRYQIVVQLMISCAAAAGCLIAALLTYRDVFTPESALNPSFRKSID
ncbi:MAG TPA: iron export ABC transporter permease subunit FetB [Firmicutes bacterium]|nr:iron export ABC transporter permease subunit FetB [Bacillota bacterium]